MTRKTYCGNLRWQSSLTLLVPEQVATRPLILQKYGQYNLFYTHDMRPRPRRRVARRSVATEPRSGRKRPRNKNVSELVFFQQANGIAAHYEYAPFGAVTATSKSTPVTAYDFREYNPFRFSSEYADDALGLVYYNYRHYNLIDGRMICRDPSNNDTLNRYVFINNRLFSMMELLGADCCEEVPKCGKDLANKGFHYYKNWGGPGWSAGRWVYDGWSIYEPELLDVGAIDALDECYKQHDLCYENCRRVMKSENDLDNCFALCDFKSLPCQIKAFANFSEPLEFSGYFAAPAGVVALGAQGTFRTGRATLRQALRTFREFIDAAEECIKRD